MIGENHDLSILAPRWTWEARDPGFELCDGEGSLTYWVREVPTPRQAATLLYEHGGPPEEERCKPYELDAAGEQGGESSQRRKQETGLPKIVRK